MAKERRGYKSPPIEEALVEFRFASAGAWDGTLPGRLHERLKETYDGRPRQQDLVHLQGRTAGLAVQRESRTQLVDTTGRRLLSIGADVLSVNVLRPYEGWAEFRPRVEEALRAYVDVSGADKVQRIGVRYINLVFVGATSAKADDYFNCAPRVAQGLPDDLSAFLLRFEHTYPDGVNLLVNFASADPRPGETGFILDIDVAWAQGGVLGLEEALQKVEVLHEREGWAFEALITDRTRQEILDA